MFSWFGRSLLVFLVGSVGLCFALLMAWQALGIGVNYGLSACLQVCIGGVVILFGGLAVHELGHLLAGLTVGLPFVRLTLGPITVVRDGGRTSARLNTAWFQAAAYVL